MHIPPYLQVISDLVVLLQIFSDCIYQVILYYKLQYIQTYSMEQYLHYIGHIFTNVGANNLHINTI